MKEPVPPSRTEQDDSLEDLELPFLEAVALRVPVLVIALFTWGFETVWLQEYRPEPL